MKRKVKLRVKIFCALGAVYFLFVLCMTVYALLINELEMTNSTGNIATPASKAKNM
ncbi:hypothetical protein [Hominenteromicrobium sp.]|uniref:hypothetical protein n=1 Tax=Hominenteromicrobium sp. TaxID=3073581 RepID=UPI003A8F1687